MRLEVGVKKFSKDIFLSSSPTRRLSLVINPSFKGSQVTLEAD